MEVKVKISLDVQAMTEFMLYQIYTGGAGIAVLVLGALNAGLAVAFAVRGEWMMVLVFAVFALLLFFGFPAVIRSRVNALQGKRKFVKPVEYRFGEEGIETEAQERVRKVPWEQFAKAVERKHILILYDKEKHPLVLPVDQLGEDLGAVKEMIAAHLPQAAVRFKKG